MIQTVHVCIHAGLAYAGVFDQGNLVGCFDRTRLT